MEAIGNLALHDAGALPRSRGATKGRRVIMSGDPAAGLLIGRVSRKVRALADCTCKTVPRSWRRGRVGFGRRPWEGESLSVWSLDCNTEL